MELGSDWHQWKGLLGKVANAAEAVGISDSRIENAAYSLGQFFTSNFDPANREQRLIKDLWDEGTEEEKRGLVAMISRLAEKDATRSR